MNEKKDARREVVHTLIGHIGETVDHLKTANECAFIGTRWQEGKLFFDFVKAGGGIAACYQCRALGDGKGIEFKEAAKPIQDLLT